ncbi:hypothetical protein D030_4903B, partial [Vibrio parahaemolyticus AQ3810]
WDLSVDYFLGGIVAVNF